MANATQAKRTNVIDVLKAIRFHSNITKPQIEKLTGLTASTVHGIVSELEQKSIVLSSGVSGSNGGRKAVLYRFNGEYRFVLSVSIRLNTIQAGLLDFDLNVIKSLNSKINLSSLGIEQTLTIVTRLINDLVAIENTDVSLIAGIGINVPGTVDFETGTVLSITDAPNWRNLPLKERMESMTGYPVFVDRDIYSGMQLLTYTGSNAGLKNALLLSVSEEIGAGIIINGGIYRGKHSSAGEIGHTTAVPNGKKCRCGNTGCLELYCSDSGIVDLYNVALPLKQKADIKEIIQSAQQGDIIASSIFSVASKHLVQTLSNLILLYDPDEIFVNCKWLSQQNKLFSDMLDKLYAGGIYVSRQATRIHLIDPQDFMLRSAAALVAMNMIASPDSPIFDV